MHAVLVFKVFVSPGSPEMPRYCLSETKLTEVFEGQLSENKSKRDNACVSVECETDLSKGPACHVKFSESCPSKTSVNLVSDKQYRGISGEPGETKTLKTRTACIQDFHPTE
jgi:hypothetical protein